MSHDVQARHAPSPDGATLDAPVIDESAALASWKYIDNFAKHGTGKAADLPFHSSQSVGNPGVVALMPAVAKRTTGEIVLECASVLKMPLADRINLALNAQRPIANAELLHHLRAQSAKDLGTLAARPGLIDTLKAMFTGPLGEVLPVLHDLPSGVVDKASWVKWFIDTTNPTVIGLELARSAEPKKLASTLDSLNEWGWLDHFHIAADVWYGGYLADLRDATKNATAKAKLTKLASAVTLDDKAQAAERAQGQRDLAEQLGKQDDVALLDATARTHEQPNADPKKVAARLAGKAPDVVLEYVIAANVDPKTAMELLLAAKAPQAEAIRAYFRATTLMDTPVIALSDDRIRGRVRKAIGRDVGLLELSPPAFYESLHPAILEHEALRQWIYEDKHPVAKLWLAAGSTGGAAKGCRLVKADRGLDWVEHLPFDADQTWLRRFVVFSTDSKATKLVRDRYLHEAASTVDPSENTVGVIDQATYGQGDKLRVKVELGQQDADPTTILARIADLTPADRRALLDDAREMADMFALLAEKHAVRAVYLLAPTVTQLLGLPIGREPGLISYVAERPAKEDAAALAQRKLVLSGRKMFDETSPLVVFPSLRDPGTLAHALADNPELLEWILADTDPNFALASLSRDPVRKVAADLMETRASAFQGFPAYRHLMPEGKQGIDAITKQVTDKETRSDLGSYREGDVIIPADNDKAGKALQHAAGVAELWTAIAELDKAGATKANMLELVRRAPSAQQVALLDGSHAAALNIVRRRTHLGPQHVFPAIPLAQLFSLAGAADWLMTDEAPTTILALLGAQPQAGKTFATYLQADVHRGSWIVSLPRGGALSDAERHTLDSLSKHISNLKLLEALFRARFDVQISGTFDLDEVRRLWSIGQRLPAAQLDQQAVRQIVEMPLGPAGQWSKPDIDISDDAERFKPKDDSFNYGQKLTAEEVKKLYGLTDKELALAADKDHGWLEHTAGMYVVKPIPMDSFTSTVLHEIGHSIDTLLGEHTELIYGVGGWRLYGVDQFEAWANEMGGLDAIDAKERPQVIKVWQEALRGGIEISHLVDETHPALSAKYAASPLVTAARGGRSFYYNERDRPLIKGRAFTQNVRNTTLLASVPQQTYNSAPSEYSLYNAAEYFAECYVEYYRAYDGTPSTEKLKGGKLATWIKTWFDQYVDKIRLNPARVRPPATK